MGRVALPALLTLYAADFGSPVDPVRFAASVLDGDDGAWLARHAESVRVRSSPYDWRIVPG